MTILLGCDEGLLQLGASPQSLPCPLRRITHLAWDGRHLAAADDTSHLLWLDGHVWPIETGLEALTLWEGRCLLLSGDTDCLTLLDGTTGLPQIVTPVGVYPQDLCLLPDRRLLAVGGGADGTLRLLTLDDLHTLHISRLPGNVQRIAADGDFLHALCLTEDDGLQCLLCRLPLFGNQYELIAHLPGLPGSIQADGKGGIWVAASEYLYYFRTGQRLPEMIIPHVGLIRYIAPGNDTLLLTDPVMEQCSLLHRDGSLQAIYHGTVGQALWMQQPEKPHT